MDEQSVSLNLEAEQVEFGWKNEQKGYILGPHTEQMLVNPLDFDYYPEFTSK